MRFGCALFLLALTACGPARFYYYPNNKLYLDPAKLNLDYEMHSYPSLNGKKIFGMVFRTANPPKGIVVHFHGNFGNVSNHFLGSAYLIHHGFDVLIFDYQGFGGSEGKPTPQNTVEDGIASIRYAASLNRNPKGGVVVVGQSIGGAAAVVAMAREPLAKAGMIEASFPSYRGMVRDVMKRSWILWPGYPLYPFFASKKWDPGRYVHKISPRPLLFIQGTADRIVPPRISEELYRLAKEPKRLWIIEGAGHIEGRRVAGDAYEKTIADFFSEALTPTNNNEALPTPRGGRSAAPAPGGVPAAK
jgi:uncharacterized protein